MAGTQFRGAEAVRNLCSVRTLFLFSLAVFGVVVAFHDYPEHEHFAFAHELLSKDAPETDMKAGFLLDDSQLQVGSVLPAPAAQGVNMFYSPVDSAVFIKGYRANWSGLAPPAVSLSAVTSLPSVSSRSLSANLSIPAQDVQSVAGYSVQGGLLS